MTDEEMVRRGFTCLEYQYFRDSGAPTGVCGKSVSITPAPKNGLSTQIPYRYQLTVPRPLNEYEMSAIAMVVEKIVASGDTANSC